MKEMKFGTNVAYVNEDDARTSITHIVQRKHTIPHSAVKK